MEDHIRKSKNKKLNPIFTGVGIAFDRSQYERGMLRERLNKPNGEACLFAYIIKPVSEGWLVRCMA